MLSGEFLSAGDRQGILIGQPLAEKLNLAAGDQIDLLVNTSNGDVDQQPFTIRGIYTTHTHGVRPEHPVDAPGQGPGHCRAENHASIIFVLLQNRDQAASVMAALQSSPFQIEDWQQMNGILAQTEQMSQAYMVVLYLIVLAITASVIVNTLVMSVFERTREIASWPPLA